MIKRIPKDNIEIRPFKAYKEWNLLQSTDGIVVYQGTKDTGSYFNSGSEPLSNGIPKRSVFDTTNQLYYKDQTPYNIIGQKGHFEDNDRTIHNYCNVISIPNRYVGEEIYPTSVTILDDVTGKTYTDDGYGNLLDGSTIIGNVIYPHGFIIATHTGSAYTASFTGDFSLDFRSTTTIYENEIFIEVEQGEFNVSQNPTAYVSDSGSAFYGYIRKTGVTEIPGQGEVYYDLNYTSSYDTSVGGGFADYDFSSSLDPTGSYLAPYITTVGLYNDNFDLVAVAKLAKPVKSLPDFPVNFIVRFDT